MIDDFKHDAASRMAKTITALKATMAKIRTGRANANLLDGVNIEYYGVETPIGQAASIVVEDARTLSVTPWESSIIPDIEKAIMKSDLGLNPTTAGNVIRIPLPALTEETRKNYTKQAKAEAENSRISIRNVRRDILSTAKELVRDKDISEDDERRIGEVIQKATDDHINQIDEILKVKEKELMEI